MSPSLSSSPIVVPSSSNDLTRESQTEIRDLAVRGSAKDVLSGWSTGNTDITHMSSSLEIGDSKSIVVLPPESSLRRSERTR